MKINQDKIRALIRESIRQHLFEQAPGDAAEETESDEATAEESDTDNTDDSADSQEPEPEPVKSEAKLQDLIVTFPGGEGDYKLSMDGTQVSLSDPDGNTIRGPRSVKKTIGAMIVLTKGKNEDARELLTSYIKKLFPKKSNDESYDSLIRRLEKLGNSLLNSFK